MIKEPQTTDFRTYLQRELVRRCESNPQYSLRAFAKSLRINHATLSSILSGRRPLTSKSIAKLGHSLSLSPIELKQYLQPISKLNTRHSPPVYHELTLDLFVSVSEWYHDAILELTHIKNFKPEAKWIAKVLGITVNEVNIAVERLQRLELLEITKKNKWIDNSRNNTTNITNDFTDVALRKYQKKILELSMSALDNVPRTSRDHTSMMVAIQKSDLKEVKKRIKKFRYELTTFLERSSASADSVYELAIAFFPITQFDIGGTNVEN